MDLLIQLFYIYFTIYIEVIFLIDIFHRLHIISIIYHLIFAIYYLSFNECFPSRLHHTS